MLDRAVGAQERHRIEHGVEGDAPPFVRLAQRVLRLPALGDVHHHGAAFLPVLGDGGLDVHPERCMPLFVERHFAGLWGAVLKHLLDEAVPSGAVAVANEDREAPAHQPVALHSQQARSGEVRAADRPVPRQGEIAHGGKVVEVSVLCHRRLQPGPRLQQLLLLHLQFDLLNLQFVDEMLGV